MVLDTTSKLLVLVRPFIAPLNAPPILVLLILLSYLTLYPNLRSYECIRTR